MWSVRFKRREDKKGIVSGKNVGPGKRGPKGKEKLPVLGGKGRGGGSLVNLNSLFSWKILIKRSLGKKRTGRSHQGETPIILRGDQRRKRSHGRAEELEGEEIKEQSRVTPLGSNKSL